MTLATSGTMSIGGTTATRSINLELGRSATANSSLNETDLRSLAGVSSGAISLSNFYGKSSSLDSQTVTVGYQEGSQYVASQYGFTNYIFTYGSISDGTSNLDSGAPITRLSWSSANIVQFMVSGNRANSGWTSMSINGQTFTRSSATYSYNSGDNYTHWYWQSVTTNPFGTTVGATRVATWV